MKKNKKIEKQHAKMLVQEMKASKKLERDKRKTVKQKIRQVLKKEYDLNFIGPRRPVGRPRNKILPVNCDS